MAAAESYNCNVTRHHTSEWVVRQFLETLREACPYRYVILDRDSKFDADVITFLKATGLKPKRNERSGALAKRGGRTLGGQLFREILDHVIALNEQHLRRLVRDYVSYHHQDRIHDSLEKEAPTRRPVEPKPSADAVVISNARLGRLHHRYGWREAA